MTEMTNIRLDGMTTPCHTPTGTSDSYQVKNLPWGAYDLVVAGFSNPGGTQLTYCSTIPIFVGAGGANPTYKLQAQAQNGGSCP
jgi:hypothetical protein